MREKSRKPRTSTKTAVTTSCSGTVASWKTYCYDSLMSNKWPNTKSNFARKKDETGPSFLLPPTAQYQLVSFPKSKLDRGSMDSAGTCEAELSAF